MAISEERLVELLYEYLDIKVSGDPKARLQLLRYRLTDEAYKL